MKVKRWRIVGMGKTYGEDFPYLLDANIQLNEIRHSSDPDRAHLRVEEYEVEVDGS